MERNREARRSATTTAGATHSVARRPRVKDASDDEDRMDEALDPRMWEPPKKERLATFHVLASNNPRNKRKRQGPPHESQASGGRLHAVVEDADESFEETEAHASEDDDEPPPPPFLRRPGKARAHAKEDEIVMDIPAVPRKARSLISASSRYSSIARRQPEPQPPEVFRQKYATPLQAPLNGSSSPNFIQKQGRKLKPVGPKVRVMKVQKVAEAASTYSDQEAEVAEALFDLSRSIPGMLDSKVEVKLEAEARTGSPPIGHLVAMGSPMPHVSGLHHPGSTANGYVSSPLKDLTASSVEAPKKKRPRVVVKPEDGRVSTPVRLVASGTISSSASPSIPNQPCLSETQPESQPEKTRADLASLASDSLKVKAATDSIVTEEKKLGVQDCDDMEQGEFIPKQEFRNVVDTGESVSDRLGEGASAIAAHLKGGIDGITKRELDNRPAETLREEASTTKLNIDLMASPLKHCGVEEDGSGASIDKTVGDNSSIIAGGFDGQQQLEDQSRKNLVLEDTTKAMDVARELSKITGKLNGEKQEESKDEEQQVRDHLQKEQTVSHSGREEEERERESSFKTMSRAHEEVSDNAGVPPFVSSTLPTTTSLSAPVALAGWMGGLPPIGYYGPGASPWAAGASLPNPGLDVKAAHSAMQLPHGPILSPVPRMKRCATHVFMAHFIYREQQVSRHSLWSAALCRAAPYNLNIPPVNMLDNDKLGGHYLDAASASQSGPSYGYTISQGVGPGMAGSGSIGAAGTATLPNHASNAGGSGDTGNAAGSGSASTNVMAAAHAQYLQAMMQQNGFASFPFPFNEPPSQAAQFFNSHFFPPHLMPPPLPHLQPLTQQSGNILPAQKQQQGVGSLPHSNPSQLVAPPLQQQLQLQLAPQSPSQSHQQHNQVGMSAQQIGIHSDKESTAGAEIASTAESRLSAMQRSMSAQQGPSNPPHARITGVGRTLNSVPPQDARTSRPASSSGSGHGQVPLLQNQPQKQAVGRAKSGPGSTSVATTVASHSVATYAERVLPGNLGKFPGTGLPYSGQMAPTSQSLKPGQAGVAAKVGQRMSPGPTMPNTSMAKSHAQQARSNQSGVPSTPPRMLPSAASSILSGGTVPMSTSHSLSVSKASTISTSKSPSNGKGSVSMTKAGPPTKKPHGSGPAISSVVISSVVSPGQNMSRAPALQKNPASAVHVPQFPQQQPSISAQQQQRLATTKYAVYPQLQPQQGQYKQQQQPFQAQSPYRPQIFLQQHQPQHMQQKSPSQQQQAVSPHTLVPISHQYPSIPQNSASQHSQASQQLSHLQQQFQPVSSAQTMTGTNGLSLSSPNLTLGTTAVSGNVSSSASSYGGGSKSNPAKTAYASGNPLPSGGIPEVITTTQSAVSGQVNSPHSRSSPYLQLAPVKPNEQKPPVSDAATREDMASVARHLASPSSQWAKVE